MSIDPDTHSFVVQPQTPRRQLRHRTSLQHILSFTLLSPDPLPHEAAEAQLLYHLILDDCQAAGIVLLPPTSPGDIGERTDRRPNLSDYDPDENEVDDNDDDDDLTSSDPAVQLHKLFRAIYDYCPTPEGRVNVVRVVLHGLFPVEDHEDPAQRALACILPRARLWSSYTDSQRDRVYRILAIFAEDFLQGFFVPLKAQGRCTPAVSTLITPTSRSEVHADQGVTTRLGDLRRLCLARDGGRCVMTHTYDKGYLKKLYDKTPRRRRDMKAGGRTEAAHIIPHSLNQLSGDATTLHPSKRLVWRILNIFAPGISNSLAGGLIDSPANAMMLIPELHERFGSLECYLKETAVLHRYTFHMVPRVIPLLPASTPAAAYIVLQNHEDAEQLCSPLPSPRLLAIHRACCMMLAMSGAAEYVESLLDDAEELMQRGVLAEDGSSNLALLLSVRGLREAEETEWGALSSVVMAK